MKNINIPIIKGIIASTILLTFYFSFLTLVNSFSYALSQFFDYWYLMIPLILGFGFQISLFFYILNFNKNIGTKNVVASGGITSLSMIACCLHLVAPLIPLIGFSGFMMFLSEYSVSFLVIGIFSNVAGILILLKTILKQKSHEYNTFLTKISYFDLKLATIVVIALAIVFIPLSFFMGQPHILDNSNDLTFDSLTNNANGLTVVVKPEIMNEEQIILYVSFDTHTGDLDFNVEDVAVLYDNLGNEYFATSWIGSQPGGHHRNGKLIFPGIKDDASEFKLVIENVFEIPKRTFEWNK